MNRRAKFVVLACTTVLVGCGSGSKTIPGIGAVLGEDTSKSAQSGSTEGSATQIAGIKLSNVTLRGLESLGIRDTAGIAAWFNEPASEDDPFLAPMEAELDRANGAAATMADLKLSAVTVEALAGFEITAPAGIAGLDRKKLKDSRKPFDLCRNEIAAAMQKAGWCVIRAEVTNRPRASSLLVNGSPLGSIEAGTNPVWRRFLAYPQGARSDEATLATLTVDLPNPGDGMPSARWFKEIELVRGGETRVSVDVGEAPAPSIGISARTPLSPAAIYAGDVVDLVCESGSDDTIWFMFSSASELAADNYSTTPDAGGVAAGLPAWLRLRASAESAASARASLLEEPEMRPIVIGRGRTLAWRPQFETASAKLGVLVRNSAGFWGFAERSIAVADLRPGIWTMPVLPIDPSALEEASRAAQAVEPSPINIYETHAILDRLLFVAKAGEAALFDLRMDEFRDASLPLAGVTIDFGDGSPVVDVNGSDAARAQIEHTYGEEGTYRISVKSTDSMGFSRFHGTNVVVRADAPPAPAPARALGRSTVRLRVAAKAAESSFDLFRRAADQFARTVAARTSRACDGRKVGLAHIHDMKDQHLVDLMDGALVSALLESGASVYEREPMFQHAIEARGMIDASKTVVPDQGGKVPDVLMQTVADGKESNPELAMRLLERIGASATPSVDVVIEYKLKRAEVTVVPAGAMVLRTARIFAWVRVHDRATMQILFDDAIEIAIGGTIAKTESSSTGAAWDSYPDGFMLRANSGDKAVESIEIETKTQTEAPAPAEEGVGGMIRGLLGR